VYVGEEERKKTAERTEHSQCVYNADTISISVYEKWKWN